MIMSRGVALLALAGLAACSNGGSGQEQAADAEAPITQSDRSGYVMACKNQAVLGGATLEQATPLCECTVDTLSQGRTAAEFDAIDEVTANQALDQCMSTLAE